MPSKTLSCTSDGVEIESSGACDATATSISFGNDGAARSVLLKFDFVANGLSVGWLTGKTITAASLTFKSVATDTVYSFGQNLHMEKLENPDDATAVAYSVSGRTKTTTKLSFGVATLGGWNVNETKRYSADFTGVTIASLINAMIAELAIVGPTTDDIESLAFIFDFTGTATTGKKRTFSSVDGGTPVLLELEYVLATQRGRASTVRVCRQDERIVRI